MARHFYFKMARRDTHWWSRELVPRFTITLEEGSFEWFSDCGQIRQSVESKTFWYIDGCIRITKEGRRLTMYSHFKNSEASILLQAGETIVGELRLSHDLEVLVKHLNERGSRVPEASRKNAVALVLWPETKRGYPKAIVEGFPSNRSGVMEVVGGYRPRLIAPEEFCVMFRHRRYLDARREVAPLPNTNLATITEIDPPIHTIETPSEPTQSAEQNLPDARTRLLAKLMGGSRRTVMDRSVSMLALSTVPNEQTQLAVSPLTAHEMGLHGADGSDEPEGGAQAFERQVTVQQEMSMSTEMLHALITNDEAKQTWLAYYEKQKQRLEELRFDATKK